MLNEVTTQISSLSKDTIFIRNLSLTLTIAIALLFVLSDLKQQNNQISEQTQIANISRSQTKFVVQRK